MKDRFWSKVEPTGFCWNWTASVNAKGYGQFRRGPTMALAHRVAYELLVGPIPDGLPLDHLCRNRRCVNPDHLEPVTTRLNNIRSMGPATTKRRHAQRTHCKNGHEFTPENTYRYKDGRRCVTCQADRDAINYAKRKAS